MTDNDITTATRQRSDTWQLSDCQPPDTEDMHRLIAEYKESGNQEIRNSIVRYHLRLIAGSARRYANAFATFDDLMAEGAISLLKAVDNFDPSREVPFTAYASTIVRYTHRGAAARSRSLVVVSAGERRRRSERLKTHAMAQHTSPTAAVPYEPMGAINTSTALDALADALACRDQSTPAVQAEQAEEMELALLALKSLPSEARRALTLRYGLFGEQARSTTELRAELGLASWQVRQLLDNAIAAIRSQMAQRNQRRPRQ